MKLIAPLILLLGCAAAPPPGPRPATFDQLDLGERVPHSVLLAAAAEARECLGGQYDLDGWTAWVVVQSAPCLSAECFLCPANTRPSCGPPPPGYTEETAPCECGGLTNFASKRIALTPDLHAIVHEVMHAGWDLTDPNHGEPEWKRCPR